MKNILFFGEKRNAPSIRDSFSQKEYPFLSRVLWFVGNHPGFVIFYVLLRSVYVRAPFFLWNILLSKQLFQFHNRRIELNHLQQKLHIFRKDGLWLLLDIFEYIILKIWNAFCTYSNVYIYNINKKSCNKNIIQQNFEIWFIFIAGGGWQLSVNAYYKLHFFFSDWAS